MGSTAVAIMASEPLGLQPKKLHPFFTEPRHMIKPSATTSSSKEEKESEKGAEDTTKSSDTKGKRRRAEDEASEAVEQEPPKRKRGRPRKHPKPPPEPAAQDLVSDKAPENGGPHDASVSDAAEAQPLLPAPASALNAEAPKDSMVGTSDIPKKALESPKPTKMLKFNPKTGTIGSPPKSREVKQPPKTSPKSSVTPTKKQRIVSIRYGQDAESRSRVGARIDAILNGNGGNQLEPSPKKAKVKKAVSTVKPHPFFLGKSATKSSPAAQVATGTAPVSKAPASSNSKIFSSTPCSPKKPRPSQPAARMPNLGSRGFGLREPGAKSPAWPWKDMVHVRGTQASESGPKSALASPSLSFRKSKGRSTNVDEQESVMTISLDALNLSQVRTDIANTNNDDFQPPPPELRLPLKHFESGKELQQRMITETSPKTLSSTALFNSISTTLSASDRSTCESQSWAVKYAPTCAAEVVQGGKEAYLLKEWLKTLKVQSVDTGQGETVSSSLPKKSTGDGPRKKRKKTKLDDFIVSSDDEADGLYENPEDELDWSPSGRHGVTKCTVVRPEKPDSKNTERLPNAVVISGPHGCGKTAAVYAVAKELDFEVFELSPSTRRSGKDIMDKVGDMTRNHLVQHRQTDKSTGETEMINPEEVADEIKSGKQSKMDSFFKAKAPPKAKSKSKHTSKKQETSSEAKKPTADQKQSLILLEEVDILYEEDKAFWATIVGLIAQSKRPFIMTCNDETLVPLHTLLLYGILRLTAPPKEASVDRLIAIAANEGHALKRSAVDFLFEGRNHDFRGSLMDLQYWCQIGVGDCRGGFEWFYPRRPKGIDMDEEGHVVRVVSENTYQSGMGWLSQDTLMANDKDLGTEQYLMEQAWNCFDVDVGQWQDSDEMKAWASDISSSCSSSKPSDRAAILEAYDQFANAMSDGDVLSCKAFAAYDQQTLDVSAPRIPTKVKEDYIIGMPLLEAKPIHQYESMALQMAVASRCLAKKHLFDTTQRPDLPSSTQQATLSTERVAGDIRDRFRLERENRAISRIDFAFAFDLIATPDNSQIISHLEASVFDRNLEPIVLDVAPYVRSIVAYDTYLQQQRLKMSNLISEGGRRPKRMRTTRAAMSAMEGGQRSTTRKEKWFKADPNAALVKLTGGEGWSDAVTTLMGAHEESGKEGNANEGESGDELA